MLKAARTRVQLWQVLLCVALGVAASVTGEVTLGRGLAGVSTDFKVEVL